MTQWEEVAKLRALEPTGLLKLTAAQIHEKHGLGRAQRCTASKSERGRRVFGDVRHQVRTLEAKLPMP